MRETKAVMECPHLTIYRVACADDQAGWSAPEVSHAVQIVLVRRGRFRLGSRGRTFTVDPTSGYLHGPGAEESFSHPAGGDECTSITLTGHALTAELDPSPRTTAVRVDARLELAHRLLLRSSADPDFAAVEAVLDLLTLSLRGTIPGASPGRSSLAERAREALAAGEPAARDLVSLAGLLETSPSHLSRTFRRHIGTPISRYRNRVRISRALARLDQGETDLALLAADLGFSDQPHFTRVLRDELGRTPAQVKHLLNDQ